MLNKYISLIYKKTVLNIFNNLIDNNNLANNSIDINIKIKLNINKNMLYKNNFITNIKKLF